MNFFIPSTKDPQEAEKVYEILKKKLAKQHGYETDAGRFYEIEYEENGMQMTNTVGKMDLTIGETVVAILQAGDRYLICTPSRGLLRGHPLVIGDWSVVRVEPFDESAPL